MPASPSPTIEDFVSEEFDRAVESRIDDEISTSINKALSKKLREAIDIKLANSFSKHIEKKLQFLDKSSKASIVENIFEDKILFGSRWILAPDYLVLILVLLCLCYKTWEEFIQLLIEFKIFDETSAVVQCLTIVDLILVMNLILMIMFVGYINFVSKIHPSRTEDWPDWTRHLDYSGLKLQLIGSMTAISAIILLRELIEISHRGYAFESVRVILMILIHITFVISAVLIAWVNKLEARPSDSE